MSEPCKEKENAKWGSAQWRGVAVVMTICVIFSMMWMNIWTNVQCASKGEAGASSQTRELNVITVSGLGEVEVVPDVAVLNLGVKTEGNTAEQCKEENDTKVNRVVETLIELGVEESAIKTSDFYITPRYNYRESGEAQLTGYTATTLLNVRVNDMELAGTVIDESVSNGINFSGGISYEISNHEDIYNEALQKAIDNAHVKAAVMTAQTGTKLGVVVQISESGALPMPRAYEAINKASYSADTAGAGGAVVMPGMSTVSADVTVIYEIK